MYYVALGLAENHSASANLKRASTIMTIVLGLILGVLAGIFSGLVGVGGGVLIVPALVFLFGMSQHQAQGTTLAILVPPIGLLAAWTYYKQGYVDLKIAALICIGFFLGGLLGAKVATMLSAKVLQRVFGVFMLLLSVKMIFGR
ncbi:MAG: sulfite exporter TauE/SafE family protein [Candidatus Melainabacteria bacterium]|nr:sulfite exporter TauE/SafE family protein [Candidatus Melainabacteria bacterium]